MINKTNRNCIISYFITQIYTRREGDALKGSPDKKRSHRLIAEVRREAGLKIGIIGVGRIGHLLATYLLKYGDVYPDELYLVSTIQIITLHC